MGRALAAAIQQDHRSLLVIDDYHNAIGSPESEQLVATLVAHSSIRLVLTSRLRPSWLTHRMAVYGEAIVVGRDELAFTDEESRLVLTNQTLPVDAALVSQSKGWPAVIGLAALRGELQSRPEPALFCQPTSTSISPKTFSVTRLDQLRRSLFAMALGGTTTHDDRQDACLEASSRLTYRRQLRKGSSPRVGTAGDSPGSSAASEPFFSTKLRELSDEKKPLRWSTKPSFASRTQTSGTNASRHLLNSLDQN